MKWFDLSLRRQIVLVGVALCLVLAGCVSAVGAAVLQHNRRNWAYQSRQSWKIGAESLTDAFSDWSILASYIADDRALQDLFTLEDLTQEQQNAKTALMALCPGLLQIHVSETEAKSAMEISDPLSDLVHFDNYRMGLTYTLIREDTEHKLRVQLDISGEKLSQCLKHGDHVNYLLVDSHHRVLTSTGYRGVNSLAEFPDMDGQIYTDSQGSRYCVTAAKLDGTGYRLVTMVSSSDRSDLYTRTIPLLIAVGVGFAVLLMLSLSLIDRTAVLPLRDMLEIISIMRKRPEAGLSLRLRGNREMQEISGNFNRMMTKNDQLNKDLMKANVRLYQSELVKRKTDLAILVSQVNPHFLYNTLSMIKGMAYRAGSQQIVDMTNALGKVFRYCLKSPDRVTLRDEMDMLLDYLTIQQARFGGRFSVDIQVPEELMGQEMLKMTLQPICENAITHGLEMMESGGVLRITAHADEQLFTITIADNGEGIPEDTLAQINAKMKRISDVAALYELGTENIGIANVHGRIRLRYGEGYGLSIFSQLGEGTCVVLRMPGRRPQIV